MQQSCKSLALNNVNESLSGGHTGESWVIAWQYLLIGTMEYLCYWTRYQ